MQSHKTERRSQYNPRDVSPDNMGCERDATVEAAAVSPHCRRAAIRRGIVRLRLRGGSRLSRLQRSALDAESFAASAIAAAILGIAIVNVHVVTIVAIAGTAVVVRVPALGSGRGHLFGGARGELGLGRQLVLG
jgi:hypothetical protein